MNDIDRFIEDLYTKAMLLDSDQQLNVSDRLKDNIRIIVGASENSKGVLAVTVTSIVYKALHPEQDVRNHQTSIPNGYSGRTFDSHHITPFLRRKSFPNMAESGWLTRSLEQKTPYTKDYPGAIKPKELKNAFLDLLDEVESIGFNPIDATMYILRELAVQRDNKKIELANPKNLSINAIIDVLFKHFNYPYKGRCASRLPVLAFYGIYQNLTHELKRFEGKALLPLENHTSADAQSGRLGDIDVVNESSHPFEAVEVKYDIPISIEIVDRAKEKILPTGVERYYILSTTEIKESDVDQINEAIIQLKNSHGCQIVVNGVIPSLKYYLRLLENPSAFVKNYVDLLNMDESVKYEHKVAWNKIIAQI